MSIGKVQIDIEEFLFETAEPCLDDKKGNEWLNRFRDTLQFKGRKANPLPFGIDCILEAEGFNAQQAVKRMSGVVKGELVKNGIDSPTTEQIEKALFERYGSEYITYKNAIRAKEQVLLRRERIKQRNIEESLGFTADGDIREDSQDRKSGTSANHYGDAAISDEAEVCPNRESGVIEPTTISDFSGARESTRTDGHSLRVGNVARPPVRSGRNSRCPNSREEFHAFVADNNLHEGLAEEWYAIHEARGWVDENGNPIKNWRGALKNFCIKVEQKRRTA